MRSTVDFQFRGAPGGASAAQEAAHEAAGISSRAPDAAESRP
ncbi:MAG: hypothetical protein ABR610_03570 [Thermoanaerobaculia bacterium]